MDKISQIVACILTLFKAIKKQFSYIKEILLLYDMDDFINESNNLHDIL